jgi:hypothetical protein
MVSPVAVIKQRERIKLHRFATLSDSFLHSAHLKVEPKSVIRPKSWVNSEQCGRPVPAASYCSFAYSALACFRMGTSGSASFQSSKN